ncbi:12666_t:CDS:2 [Cetraspora pellucida]|uniref:12666_t:CDS:1 n=1 Tax=Cetraspora pellucida TaxID=1433469 RepID=A0ACA9MCY5_9GLOM|nr:12666_t:CDS:2 [Cetraspora pellucida]
MVSAVNESYLSLTVYFIIQEWELKKILLDIIPMNEKHTASYIVELLYNVLNIFSLKDHVISLTTDNSSNMVACSSLLATVQHGLKVVGPELKKLHYWISKLKKSSCLTDEMRQIFQRQLKNKDINEILVFNNKQTLKNIYPNENEWSQLHDLEQVLQPIYEAIQLLSTSKYLTLDDMHLLFLEIFDILNNFINSNSQNEVAKLILKKLEDYWNLALDKTSLLLAVLDP